MWSGDYFTPLIGRHQAGNAALALAAGAALGMGREAWLKDWRPVRNRSSVCNGPKWRGCVG